MDTVIQTQLEKLNQHQKRMDMIYHGISAEFGLSTTAMWVLYAVANLDGPFSQNDLCDDWHFPKQTVNSAINALVKRGLVMLEPAAGYRNKKYVCLTEEGSKLAEETVIPLYQAETRAFLRMEDAEREKYLSIEDKHIAYLQEEIGKLRRK